MRIWTFLALLGLAGPALAQDTGPSYDCTKASGSVEEAVCASMSLSALDREVATLYGLAKSSVSGSDADRLTAYQRGWIKGRNDCWKAGDRMQHCIAAAYLDRIHDLRTEFAAARSNTGGSFGPFIYTCDGMEAPISVVFADIYASVRSGNQTLTLPHVRSGSGGKYEDDAGNMIWSKGGDAQLVLNGVDTSCSSTGAG